MIRKGNLERIIELLNEGVWRLDKEDNFAFINERGAEILGYEPRELIDRPAINLFIPREGTKGLDQLEELKIGMTRSTAYLLRHRDGSAVRASLKATPLIDDDGTYLGLVAMFIDSNNRNKADAAFLDSEEKYRSIVEAVQEGIIISDLDGRMVYANERMTFLLGYRPEDLVGKLNIDLIPEVERDKICRKIIAREKGIRDSYEILMNRQDGGIVWLLANDSPLYDRMGNHIANLGTYSDITERMKMEQDLKRSNEELQQFAYIASHDLQEPLRTITNYLSLLKKIYGEDLPSQAKEFISIAIDGADRMRQLVKDLLAYARIETQGNAFTQVDMNEVAQEVRYELHVPINEVKAQVVIQWLPSIPADEAQMKQLLTNLIGNAIKFHRNEPPRIEVSSFIYGSDYIFAVQDNGIGIDSRYVDKIFRMFERLHTKDEYPGTGIGLTIARKIVERHGGRIWVESELGIGSTFFFTLPGNS